MSAKIEHAFDGFFYPMVMEGDYEYEYVWGEDGNEVRFLTEAEAGAFLAGAR